MARKPTYEELEKESLERKRAEEDLDRIFNLSLDMLCIAGLDGYFKRLNPAFEKTLGYTNEELLDRPFLDFIHPEDRATSIAKIKRLAADALTVYFENRYRCKDGSYKWLAWSGAPLAEEGLVYAVGRDITGRKRAEEELQRARNELERRFEERTAKLVVANKQLRAEIEEHKQAEEALRQSEDRYKTLTESSLTGIYIHQDGKYVFVNDRFAQIHGYEPEELLGEHYLTLIHPDERERVSQAGLKRLRGEPAPKRYEVKRLRKDGEAVWCETIAARIEYKGKPGIMGNIVDINKRKRTEEALRIKDSAIESSINAIALAEPRGNLTYVNKSFLRLWGYHSDQEVIGRSAVEFWQVQKKALGIIEALWETGSWVGELVARRSDGSLFDAQFSASMVTDEAANPVLMMGSCFDITERKRAVQALKEREAELEIKTNSLEEMNTALRVLLKRRDEDKTELEEKVLVNVRELVLPFLKKVKNGRLDPEQMAYIRVLESNLNDIVSPFLHTLSSKYSNLTPTEIRVAHLIKDGKTTKEVANLMNLSIRTIDFHRENIRKKLGIKNRKTNLRTHLLSIQ
jgi:PAS domain S-box-containing protein